MAKRLTGNIRKHKRGLRVQTVQEVIEARGECPVTHLIRIAYKAENQGDLALASGNWKEILCYLQAKMKPIDPAENAIKAKNSATLEELAKIKAAILKGDMTEINEQLVIEHEPDIQTTLEPKRSLSELL